MLNPGQTMTNPIDQSRSTDEATWLQARQWVAANMRLVHWIADTYRIFMAADEDDLFQEATLAAFQVRHGIQVVAISVDGGPLPSFPNTRPDNGIATALKVSQVPAVFLAQPFTGKISPIGFGVLSESQLMERIAVVSGPQAQAMLPGPTQRLALPQEIP